MKKKIFYLCLLFCIISAGYAYYRFGAWNTVSIILPAYNVEKYIDDCLTSLTSQSYKNLEIIAVDDSSTDHTYEILQDWARKDKRIKLFHNEKNQGAALTRERALKEATGKYTMFVDSDDYISPSYIKAMVRAARKSGVDAVFNNSVVLYNDYTRQEQKMSWWFPFPEGEIRLPPACQHEQSYLWGKLFKTSFLKRIDISLPTPLRYHSDMYISAVIKANLPHIYVISHPAYYYRFWPGSLQMESGKTTERAIHMLRAQEMILTYWQERGSLDGASVDIFQLVSQLERGDIDHQTYYDLLRKFFMKNEKLLLQEEAQDKTWEKFVSAKKRLVPAVLANKTWEDFLKNTTQKERDFWMKGLGNRPYCRFLLRQFY